MKLDVRPQSCTPSKHDLTVVIQSFPQPPIYSESATRCFTLHLPLTFPQLDNELQIYSTHFIDSSLEASTHGHNSRIWIQLSLSHLSVKSIWANKENTHIHIWYRSFGMASNHYQHFKLQNIQQSKSLKQLIIVSRELRPCQSWSWTWTDGGQWPGRWEGGWGSIGAKPNLYCEAIELVCGAFTKPPLFRRNRLTGSGNPLLKVM